MGTHDLRSDETGVLLRRAVQRNSIFAAASDALGAGGAKTGVKTLVEQGGWISWGTGFFTQIERGKSPIAKPDRGHKAMPYENEFYPMHAMTRRRWATLGVLTLAFAGAIMTTACSAPGGPGPGSSGGAPSSPDQPAECSASVEEPCMRYHIPLFGNPSMDLALRDKYIAAFGNACYMSHVNTFDCFYQKWQTACADAVKIAEVSGNAPFDKGYTCQPVAGTDDYTLQVGPDIANKITINYQAAPRQTPLVEINGTPTEVNGPYRNLTEPNQVGPGTNFRGNSGMADGDGGFLTQREWILQVNRNAHGGQVHSDLAGFAWPCKDQDGGITTCTEPLVLPDPQDPVGTAPEVHHVVPMKDKRCCPWGTNSNKNAAVISRKLNEFFTNNNPPVKEVEMLNNAKAYTP